jgi:hypothetical protein
MSLASLVDLHAIAHIADPLERRFLFAFNRTSPGL